MNYLPAESQSLPLTKQNMPGHRSWISSVKQIALGQAGVHYLSIDWREQQNWIMRTWWRVWRGQIIFPRAKVLDQHGTWQDAGRTKGSEYAALCSRRDQIMVGTTVIEVGSRPTLPWWSAESAEKFGLSQLHQLRDVWAGAEQSYCILLSGSRLGQDARERLKIMASTNDGFVIAEKILNCGARRYRGYPAKRMLSLNWPISCRIERYRSGQGCCWIDLLNNDPDITFPKNPPIRQYLQQRKDKTRWAMGSPELKC